MIAIPNAGTQVTAEAPPVKAAAKPQPPPTPVDLNRGANKPARAKPPTSAFPKPPMVPPPPPSTIGADIARGFSGPIQPVRASMAYRMAQAVVAVVMLILPLAYVGIICGVCWLYYLHATHSHVIFTHVHGRASLIALLIYAGPLIAGAIQILFMLKPLFASPADDVHSRAITPQGEPHVFALVAQIANAVGAPLPKRIEVVCDMNAAAAFQRGLWSMFLGNDLKLLIGIPLVSGLTLQQFAGVLAHELGHFSQGGGMRLSYVIRRINGWFARVVYSSDSWDEWLSHSMEGMDFRIAWIFGLAKVAIYLTRGVLWCLMILGLAVSGVLMRQMEYNADLFETRLVGSETFAATTKRFFQLSVGWQATEHDAVQFFRQGKLADNFSKLVLFNVNALTPDVRRQMREVFETEQTGIFDSHPVNRDRIAASARENAPGVFRSDRPASDLFVYYDSLCKNVTWDYYQGVLGPSVKPNSLTSTDELLRFVQTPSTTGMPVTPSAKPTLPDDPDAPIPLAD
ncbi:MAG: M48 family metalloprotease [Planctomycetia bacterium]|nr:M48 family metalloprotease [Planctomycetia bacterium]